MKIGVKIFFNHERIRVHCARPGTPERRAREEERISATTKQSFLTLKIASPPRADRNDTDN